MRVFLKFSLAVLSLLLLIACTSLKEPPKNEPEVDKYGRIKVVVPEVTEKKEVNLEHPLYKTRNIDYSFGDDGTVYVPSEYCLQNVVYKEQDIRSAEQALAYYERVDPWNFISENDFVVVDIGYDAKYDAWCMVLVRSDAVDDWKYMLDGAWFVWFLGNGQFLCREE